MHTTPNDVRAAATATIALVLFLMVGLNSRMFNAQENLQVESKEGFQRGIASVPKMIEPQWRKNLSGLNKDMIAQSAHKPTPIESLNFGILEGKYAMQVQGGRVTLIEFADAHNMNPKFLQDRMGFIQQFSTTLAPNLKSIEKLSYAKSGEGYKEVFKVMADEELYFEFQLDDKNRLLSLKIK